MNVPKYRAFHKQRQIMLPVPQVDLDPEHGGVFVESNDGSYCGCRLHMELWPWSDIELMQFTGLQDCTGKDIYQSDIFELNCLGYGGPYKDRVVVVWEGFGWYFRFADGRLQPVEQKWQSECEVIGNVWEHPQLLQSKESQA